MRHPLDPGAPLRHADGSEYSEAERQTFFENVEQRLRYTYREERANHYVARLTVGEQLDMLWHELDQTGVISKDGAWFKAIKAVKEAYPNDDSAYQKAVADIAALKEA